MMIIEVDGVNIQDMEEFDERVASIHISRYHGSYRIELRNKEGYQIGDATYVGTKEDKNAEVKYLKEKYNI